MDTTYRLQQTGEQVQNLLNQIPSLATELLTKYTKPVDGIPDTDLTAAIQQALALALTAYQKPGIGIPKTDLTTAVQNLLDAAGTAYQKPGSGIPKTDLATAVQNLLDAAGTAYQKPASGIPLTDLAASVQAAINASESMAQDLAAERLARETADLAINEALGTKLNQSQVQAIVTAALANYDTAAEVATAISTALASYYTKAQSYSKTEVDALVEPKQTQAQVEAIVSSALASYSTTSEVSAAISTALTLYYTKTEVDAKLALKQDKLAFDLVPTLNSPNPVTSNGVKTAIDGEATARNTADGQLMTLIGQIQAALLNYYLKTETYNRSEIDQLVAAVGKFQSKIVTTLPEPSLDTTGWIYLVPSDNPKTQNVKEEYITVLDGSTYNWEHIGSTNIDLSGYSTTEQMNTAISTALQAYSTTTEMNNAISSAISTALASYSTTQEVTAAISSAISTALSSYYTKTEVDNLLASKQDTISDLQTIRSGAAAGATAVQPAAIGNMEVNTNKVTEIGPSSTDVQYPSAKAVYTPIKVLQDVVADLETIAEGYVRVAGSSSPALSYKSYKYHEQGGFGRESVFHLFYPCLVGTPLTGVGTEGKILHILQKLDYGHDIYGNVRAIDGSEGDVMICNIEPYFRIMGKYTIEGTEYDVFLVSRTPFTWQGIDAEEVMKGGHAPDFCVSHTDTDNVVRMHSVYNPAWDGSYAAPAGVVGKYVQSVDAETGDIVETYDENETLLGGAGGLHTTDLALYDGEQRAMNNNPDTTKCVPWMNETAASVEDMFALMLAEGGTFDAHNATLMGSGFSSNDPATAAGDWEESGSGAKNGLRVQDKNGTWKYYALAGNVRFLFGESSGTRYAANCINSWRNPFHIMEAHRAVSYAIQNGVHELEWFVFDGNKYKYRSVNGFNGPAQGEMTCVVWKLFATKAGSAAVDPTDGATSIAGNRVEILVSVALFHGITTQVSPSWWTSGLLFTEDENGQYECFIERDQAELVKSIAADNYDPATPRDFETIYDHVLTVQKGDGYAKNYLNGALMLPDSNANKTGAGLHTYVGKYNWFAGENANAGKKSVRGFRRGANAGASSLSPLTLYAPYSPSSPGASIGFGTCCRISE